MQNEPQELQTFNTFLFSDSTFSIEHTNKQVLADDYGLFIWPSSKILAEFLWKSKSTLKGKRILELGSGTALPSLVCGACGAHVVATDKAESTRVLKNIENTILSNNPIYLTTDEQKTPFFMDIKVLGFSWGMFNSQFLSQAPFDLIIGADLFYDNTKDYENIFASVVYCLKCNPRGKFLTTYQPRSSRSKILFLQQKWNLNCVSVPIESEIIQKYNLETTIELMFFFEINRKTAPQQSICILRIYSSKLFYEAVGNNTEGCQRSSNYFKKTLSTNLISSCNPFPS